MDGDILVSSGQMMRAFVRWDEAYRENPKAFRDIVQRVFDGSYGTKESGQISANYFRSLLIEVR